MKVIGIAILLLLVTMVFSVGFDVIWSNRALDTSIKNTLNPFYVMETGELIIFLFLLLSYLLVPLYSFVQKKKAKANENEKQN